MAKYNITERKVKEAAYRSLVNPQVMEDMKVRIEKIIVKGKKYKDKTYSAKKLAEDLGTNTRYVSAVVNVSFKMNYTSYVNMHRVQEAMAILSDPTKASVKMEEISKLVGFSNRQSFYAAFYRNVHTTPREYRLEQLGLKEEEK